MAGEIERLPIISPTHFVGHDADGYAGRFIYPDRVTRVSVDGAIRLDETGRERVPAATVVNEAPLLKDVIGRGRIFGCAVPQAFRLDPGADTYVPGLADLSARHADIWVYDSEFQPGTIQPTQGVFNLAPATAAIARAQAAAKLWRLHLLFYPAHDMPWINATTLTGATYKSIVDAHLNAVASIPGVQGAYNIDVANELFDGFNTLPGGYRPNQWYTASAPGTVPSSAPGPGVFDGPDWVAYLFLRARQKFPGVPLYFCHDQIEQVTTNYHVNHNANILNFLTKAVGAGIPVDGLNMQGHLSLTRGFDAPKLKAFMSAVKALGLKIMIGELDCRSGDDSFAAYTRFEYDRRCADLIRRFLDVALPFLERGDPLLSWGMCDIRHAWTIGERPLPFDEFYQPKQQYAAIRDALKEAN